MVEDLSSVAPLNQDNLNFDEVAKFVIERYPNIHVNEVASWRYILEKGQLIVGKLIDFILSAPPENAVEYTVDILVCICRSIPAKYK